MKKVIHDLQETQFLRRNTKIFYVRILFPTFNIVRIKEKKYKIENVKAGYVGKYDHCERMCSKF